MKKIKELWSKHSTLIIIIALVLITVILLISKCSHSLNNDLVDPNVGKIQETKHGKLNDSTVFAYQAVLLAQTQAQVHMLESKLQEELIRKIKIGKTTTSIEFRDSIVYIEIPGTRDHDRDSLTVSTTHPPTTYPMYFKHSNDWLKENYVVYSPDSSSIDKLNIIGKGHLVIGETGKWFQKKTLTVGLMNENPYILIDSLKSIVYKPKSHLELSVGPIVLLNKTGTSLGAGITIKKGIFSTTIGYKLY